MSNFTNFQNILTGPFREIIFFVFFGLFWCFGVSFSLSHAVSACFWHCIWHLPTPDICLTHSDTILTLPDTLRHHPDTPQTSPYLVCMRPLGERVISEYHDIYSTVFNLSDICQTKTSARHAQTPSRHCQTPSDTILTLLRHPHIWSARGHWEKEWYLNTMIFIQLFSIYLISVKPRHAKTPSWHCQTPSETIQTPISHPHILPAWCHWEKE